MDKRVGRGRGGVRFPLPLPRAFFPTQPPTNNGQVQDKFNGSSREVQEMPIYTKET